MREVGVAGIPVTLFAVGLVVSAIVGYLTIKFFLRYLANHSLAVFAFYRFALAAVTVVWLVDVGDAMAWLRRSFITGFFVTVPLIISVAALVWIFQVVDGVTEPMSVRVLGRAVPGLGVLLTAAIILLVGAVATNVIGKRVLQRAEYYLLQVPVFKTIYAPVKQLVAAFSPDNEAGFKKVVIVEDPRRGMLLGFLDEGVHARSRPRAGAGGGGLRADQSPVSRRRRSSIRASRRAFPICRSRKASGSF